MCRWKKICDLSICFVSVPLGWLRGSPVLVPTAALVPVISSPAPPRGPCSQAQGSHHIPMLMHSLRWWFVMSGNLLNCKGGLCVLSLSWSHCRRGWNYGSFIPNFPCEIQTPSWWLNCIVPVNFPGRLCFHLPASRTDKASQDYHVSLSHILSGLHLGLHNPLVHLEGWEGRSTQAAADKVGSRHQLQFTFPFCLLTFHNHCPPLPLFLGQSVFRGSKQHLEPFL